MQCCSLLIAEHRQTELLVAQLRVPLADWNAQPSALAGERVTALYQRLCQDLIRHFALEEQALFAPLSAYRTMILMEVEHDDLLILQATFTTALQESLAQNAPTETLLPAWAAFEERLLAHIQEEEQGIFPMAERVLDTEGKQRVLRLMNERQAALLLTEPVLQRPAPGFQVKTLPDADFSRPMQYQTLYDREHTQLQRLTLRAGQKQSVHWAGQHQLLCLLRGAVQLWVGETATPLSVGQIATLDSRLAFALESVSDSEILLFRVWPHPHYTKAP
jgi:hemerythrin-like domain-containing protein